MAPEYLVRGQLSEKTDVYAFGVLSLEISCGRKNNVFVHDLESVLHCVRIIFNVKANFYIKLNDLVVVFAFGVLSGASILSLTLTIVIAILLTLTPLY